jgi:hypothetical protein
MLKPFETPIHAQRTYRELKLLIYLNHRDADVCANHSLIFIKHYLSFSYYRLYNYTMCLHLKQLLMNLKHCMFRNFSLSIDIYILCCSTDILYSILVVLTCMRLLSVAHYFQKNMLKKSFMEFFEV